MPTIGDRDHTRTSAWRLHAIFFLPDNRARLTRAAPRGLTYQHACAVRVQSLLLLPSCLITSQHFNHIQCPTSSPVLSSLPGKPAGATECVLQSAKSIPPVQWRDNRPRV